ncbi:MAG TPA: adenylyl-sulfate kinase [Candidatus Limnocylindrales bacterium]
MSVVWLHGPLGAGKTTLAHALRALVHPVAAVALLDEDAVREAVADATMSWAVNDAMPLAQLGGMARVLAGQGLVVIVSASDVEASLLTWNREHLPGYREVFLRASPETIKHHARRHKPGALTPMQRDGAGTPEQTAPSPPPRNPDLTLDMDNPEPPELLAFRVAVLIPEFVAAAAGAAGAGAAAGVQRLRRGA